MPLHWYTSATFAQFPDETRPSIHRSFVSPFAAHARRNFCGYCGTQLSSWNERTRDEAEHICLTVGSLLDEDQALLAELGLLPGNESSEDEERREHRAEPVLATATRSAGAPWFEDLVQHSRLGRFKRQRGGHTNSGVHVEWEVMEWTEGDDADDEALAPPSKRKIGDVEAGEDTDMRSA